MNPPKRGRREAGMRLVKTAGRVFRLALSFVVTRASALSLVCGGVYGLALARYLFELNPQRFAFLAGPGVLAAAADKR